MEDSFDWLANYLAGQGVVMKSLAQAHTKESNKDGHFVSRVIILAVSVAVFAYSFAVLVLNVDARTLAYHESGNIDYQVCLKPNSYFTESCQPSKKQYVASLIDSLKAELNYSFQADDSVEYEYTYDIVAKLLATEPNDSKKILYEDEEVLKPSRTIQNQSGRGFSIHENIDVDYGKYNNLVNAFRSDYGLTIEASVDVVLNVKVRATYDGFSQPIETRQAVALKIPLSERTINIMVESDQLNRDGTIEEKVRDLSKNLLFVIAAGVSGLVFLIVLALSITILVRRKAKRTTYEKTLGHILHEYNQIIVNVEHMPQTSRDKLIEVTDFNELLDARDTIQQPILHLRIGDDRSVFAIEDQGMVYAYVLSAKSLQQKGKK
ncbi:MAG: DUF5305 domain-containing protein [Candidatus Nomurabacteria bacterium]|nr:DUF5305 domain-containing protein [Candidatus Nomurabacteria bacterium]